MDTLPTPSSTKKLLMWHKVNHYFFVDKLNKAQIARMLGIHRGTVKKYLGMTEEEFASSDACRRYFPHKLDQYEGFVAEQLRNPAGLSCAQIEDRLRALPGYDRGICSKTVFNFVQYVRKRHSIPKPTKESGRLYEKLEETPYGEWAQADFGEMLMLCGEGARRAKVYFFAMVLSRSRAKFVFLSLKPFNTALAVYAHELAFQYWGGIPKRILYDQDRVLIRDENLGDLVLTRGFRAFCAQSHFEPVFCRKSDPESKGKVENVVGYVKKNFLHGRTMETIEKLNEECVAWLERTANGTVHAGTRLVPARELEAERRHLRPYSGIPTEPKADMREYKVLKDHTVSYRGNYYTVPTGTYSGPDTRVFLEERDGWVRIYSRDTGKMVAEHALCLDKGKLVSNSSHKRAAASYEELEARVYERLGRTASMESALRAIRESKPRYYGDALRRLCSKLEAYHPSTLNDAISECMARRMPSVTAMLEVAESFRVMRREKTLEPEPPACGLQGAQAQTRSMAPEKSDIAQYQALFN